MAFHDSFTSNFWTYSSGRLQREALGSSISQTRISYVQTPTGESHPLASIWAPFSWFNYKTQEIFAIYAKTRSCAIHRCKPLLIDAIVPKPMYSKELDAQFLYLGTIGCKWRVFKTNIYRKERAFPVYSGESPHKWLLMDVSRILFRSTYHVLLDGHSSGNAVADALKHATRSIPRTTDDEP